MKLELMFKCIYIYVLLNLLQAIINSFLQLKSCNKLKKQIY